MADCDVPIYPIFAICNLIALENVKSHVTLMTDDFFLLKLFKEAYIFKEIIIL